MWNYLVIYSSVYVCKQTVEQNFADVEERNQFVSVSYSVF